jgi:uridine kinase
MKLRLTTEVVKKVLASQRKSGSRFTYVTYLNSLPAANPDDLLMSDVVDNFHRTLRERIAKQGRLKAALVMEPSIRQVARPVPGRRVVIIGVEGRSGSGKSSLAQWLSRELKSPYNAIGTDSFVRKAHHLPVCPHLAPPNCVQWCRKACYELPGAYDLNLFKEEIVRVRKILESCSNGHVPVVYLETPKNYVPLRPRQDLEHAAPVYLVVEGFILFVEPQIIGECKHLLRLSVPPAQSCLRRFHRERKAPKQWQGFRLQYLYHVDAARQSLMPLVERNLAGRHVHNVDASGDQEAVRQTVLQAIRASEKFSAAIR